MEIRLPERNFGDKVFVRLGYLTVKQGAVAGARVTATGPLKEHKVEYLIQWFGAGDRPEKAEWFDERDLTDTAEDAFAPLA
jgi:hypothetical protein